MQSSKVREVLLAHLLLTAKLRDSQSKSDALCQLQLCHQSALFGGGGHLPSVKDCTLDVYRLELTVG